MIKQGYNYPNKKKDRKLPKNNFGKFTEIFLKYNEKTIDKNSMTFLNKKPKRPYLIFTPKNFEKQLSSSHSDEKNEKIKIVFLLHGTNETGYDQELIIQEKKDELSFLEYSNKYKFLIIIPQSRGILFEKGKTIQWGWQPDEKDILYIKDIINDVTNKYNIDNGNCFCVGFSNGGIFTSDIILKTNFFKAVVNYMGGLTLKKERNEAYQKIIEENKDLNKPKLLIITGSKDENLNLCENAKQFFEKNNYQVKYLCMDRKYHEYLAESTPLICEFFFDVEKE